ncbi:MAG: hypothetical protein AUG51_12745 [Acidobacteria bacterium 13_1_20CM_3_53_8]|nr:MAG: hypothetical protein AUG51_12745 [Acidobacteria bacterium 13_1_20CM_3_53_8]
MTRKKWAPHSPLLLFTREIHIVCNQTRSSFNAEADQRARMARGLERAEANSAPRPSHHKANRTQSQ